MHDEITICLDDDQGNDIDELVGTPFEEPLQGIHRAL